MATIAKLLARGAVLISGTALALILILVSAQIGMRVFLGRPLSWPDELSRILFIYLVFIGAAETSARHAHIAVNIQDTMNISARVDRVLDFFRMTLTLVVLAIIAWGALQIIPVVSSMQLPATGVSMALMTIPVVIGSIMMMCGTVLQFIASVIGRDLFATGHAGGRPDDRGVD